MILLFIALAAIFVIALAAVLSVSSDATPQKGSNVRPRNNARRKCGAPERKWNGFSDPDDFPTDGCGDNGW